MACHHSLPIFLATVAVLAHAGVRSVTAQSPVQQPVDATTPSPGWTVTPSFGFSNGWDTNVLVRSDHDRPTGDFVSVFNPRGDVSFNGRHSQVTGAYSGAFLVYRDLDTLNSYDQHGAVSARRLISRRLTAFGSNTISLAPTTEMLQLSGVPFVRTGATIDDLRGGVEATLTRRTSVVGGAHFQWTRFDENRPLDTILRGGHSRGGWFTFRHILSKRTTLTADYDLHHAMVGDGQATFNVQNGSGGLEYKTSETLRLFGAGGLSHLGLSRFGPARTGFSYRAGIAWQFQAGTVDSTYSRSFIPSFGFGGTMQNEDLTTRLHLSLSPRSYIQSGVSWRRNEPLTVGELKLRSLWMQFLAGYELQPWARVEGFYMEMAQQIDRPGGELTRRRVGFQFVATKPMRIR